MSVPKSVLPQMASWFTCAVAQPRLSIDSGLRRGERGSDLALLKVLILTQGMCENYKI
jgi:hypothetical protein